MVADNGQNGHRQAGIVIWVDPRSEREGDQWVAYFDKMKLAGQGPTQEAAEENLIRHVVSHCLALLDKGLLKQALEEYGVEYDEKEGRVPAAV